MKEDKIMISFTKKNRTQNNANNDYNNNTDNYNGYTDYSSEYVNNDFGEEVEETPAEYTEPTIVDKKPEEDLMQSKIKLIKFSTPAEREKVAECLKDGCAVIFELTDLDRSDWFRVIDYIQGALFMLGGTISRFSENSLVAAPKNFDVSKIELDEEPEEEEETEETEETEDTEKVPTERKSEEPEELEELEELEDLDE